MRYLIVGLGNIGRKRRVLLGERCVATADPVNPDADYVDPREYPVERYDAAILAVPNEAKLGLMEYFLAHGKHVLVEKPVLFANDPSAERLERLARDRGAIWYTSYNHRFEPLIAALKEQLDAERIGRVYSARLFYGNGTVGNVVGTWRDRGLGVVEDLGSHLLDLAGWLFGCRGVELVPWSLRHHEAVGLDHGILATPDGEVILEITYLSWKNTFGIDVIGERGSLHLHGLRKWGPSELILHERVLPSGAPRQTRQTSEGPDVTWQGDLAHFEALAAAGMTSLDNDRWISHVLRSVALLESTATPSFTSPLGSGATA